jgi:Fur family zinc uptake transcriptional regulator
MTASVEEVGGQLDKAAEVCAQNGVRFTKLRRQILSLVLAAAGPVGAYDLLDRLRAAGKAAAPHRR